MIKHALLSASSSHRWLACPPSARLCASMPDMASDYAREGTEAHSLCEYLLSISLGMKTEDQKQKLEYMSDEMAACADMYVSYVLEQVESAKKLCSDPLVLIEQRLDYSRWVPEGFGTGDCIIAADKVLSVIDFKYGMGVLVEAEQNSQMMCYALGALVLFDGIYDIDEIAMTIFQPRRENVSTYIMSRSELLEWADTVLKPRAELAVKGEGEFLAGDHCRFCKAKATCRKRAEYNLELAKYDFAMPSTLTDSEVETVLARADQIASWASDVKEYALQQAVQGKKWHDWKLVEGRSIRKYTNEQKVAECVKASGYDPYEHSVLGITAMTRMLGKKKFDELLGNLVHKPPGKPTLVPLSDKRHAMKNAVNDFKEEI